MVKITMYDQGRIEEYIIPDKYEKLLDTHSLHYDFALMKKELNITEKKQEIAWQI